MHPGEVERFWRFVRRGPAERDCWLWVGAIADDGYGRFWTKRNGHQVAQRPHRYAFQLATGLDLTPTDVLMHRCDVPICVRATADEKSHLCLGDVAANMADRARKGRHANGATSVYWRGITRHRRAQLSRDLRDVILDVGWDRDRLGAAVAGQLSDDAARLF